LLNIPKLQSQSQLGYQGLPVLLFSLSASPASLAIHASLALPPPNLPFLQALQGKQGSASLAIQPIQLGFALLLA